MTSMEHFADEKIVFWIAVAVMCVTPALAWAWCTAKKSKYENELKRTMIEQGMSADDIDRVLKAGSSGDDKESAR